MNAPVIVVAVTLLLIRGLVTYSQGQAISH